MNIERRNTFMKMGPDQLRILTESTIDLSAVGPRWVSDLTFLAEALGEVPESHREWASKLLLRLLVHPAPVVREGALLGLSARKMNAEELHTVGTVSEVDADITIREIAQYILQEIDEQCNEM